MKLTHQRDIPVPLVLNRRPWRFPAADAPMLGGANGAQNQKENAPPA